MASKRKLKKILIVSLVVLIVIVLSLPLSCGLVLKVMYSKNYEPGLYIVPVERKIESVESIQNSVKVNYGDFEIKLPCKKIIKKGNPDKSINRYSFFWVDKGTRQAVVTFCIPNYRLLKSEFINGTLFESFNEILSITPEKIHFFNLLNKRNMEEFLILGDKDIHKFHMSKIYKFEMSGFKGFQIIRYLEDKKDEYNGLLGNAEIYIFDKDDHPYKIAFVAFSQKEIDYALASIKFKE